MSIHVFVTLRGFQPRQHTSSRKRHNPSEYFCFRRRTARRDALRFELYQEKYLLTRVEEDFTSLKGTRDDTDRLLEVLPSRSRHGNAVYPPRVARYITGLRNFARLAIALSEEPAKGNERVRRCDGIAHDRHSRLVV